LLTIDLAGLTGLRDRMRAQSKPSKRPWYRIQVQNAATGGDGSADVWIYDEISWLGITAQSFVRDLQDVTASTINLHLNSPGGDVFDGIAIYNALRFHPARVISRVEGIAASIASVIAMAGDEIVMAPHSTMMIHDPWGIVLGNAADLRKEADILDQLGENIAGIYREQGGGKLKQWRDRMLEETWLTDEQAVAIGLADRIDDGAEPVKASFDLSMFRNPPADLVGTGHPDAERPPTMRDAERALRDAGFSRAFAKSLVANGWWARDEDQDDDGEERDVPSESGAEPAINVEDSAETEVVLEQDLEDDTAESIAIAIAARARTIGLFEMTGASL
jgi:ATP-dependent protease ClpP protease subunit